MINKIKEYFITGLTVKDRKIMHLELDVIKLNERIIKKNGEILDLEYKINELKEKNTKYKEKIKTLQEELENKEKEILELKANQKQKGEYLVRKVSPGRPKTHVQEMNLKSRHYAKGTVKQLKELEENRG